MFDFRLPEPDALAALDDAALVTVMAECAAAEAAAAGRRLAVIAEFTSRRLGAGEHADWACDDWDAASVEIGAALGSSLGRASHQMNLGLTLRNRLPKVAALLAAGQLPLRLVTVIVGRTNLVVDREALDAFDAALAEHAVHWGLLSQARLEAAIDVWVCAVDPDAVHRSRSRSRSRDRDIQIGDNYHGGDGLTSIVGRLLATDGKLLAARLTAMAQMVCDADPRTMAQRRADALGALGAGRLHLTCLCRTPSCSAAADDGRASSITVHVLATAEALDAATDPGCHGEHPAQPPMSVEDFLTECQAAQRASTQTDRNPPHTAEASGPAVAAESTGPATAPAAPTEPCAPERPAPPRHRAGLIVGGAVVPAPLLANLIAGGAKISPLQPPYDRPHPGYRLPATSATLVRMRDLTCRAPGCDRPAVEADIDHTIPWPTGPTHPSNTKCYCRKHHLAKTFWPGFTDRQHPDGTIEFTTPTGHTYTTRPLSGLLFPTWNTTTATLPEPSGIPAPATGHLMPKRKRTRTEQRRYRINTERSLNAADNVPPF